MEPNTLKDNGDAGKATHSGQYTTFFVDGLCFGVDVLTVQEVLRPQATTRVPLAPDVVKGLINLRGQIVTAVDMRRRLGLKPRAQADGASMNIVVRTDEEAVSLLVDEIGDVLQVEAARFERRPNNIDAQVRDLIQGVYKLEDRLLLVLDTNRTVARATSD